MAAESPIRRGDEARGSRHRDARGASRGQAALHAHNDAVRGLRAASSGELLVEGWVEGPCAEAANLRGLNRLMIDFFDEPGFVGDLLRFVRELEIPFASRR